VLTGVAASVPEIAVGVALAGVIAAAALPGILRRSGSGRGRRAAALAAALLGLLGLVLRPHGLATTNDTDRVVLATPGAAAPAPGELRSTAGGAAASAGGIEAASTGRTGAASASGAEASATGGVEAPGVDGTMASSFGMETSPGDGLVPALAGGYPLRVAVAEGGEWRPVPDARTLWRREPWLRGIEVRGYGLDDADFLGFRGSVERFAPPPLPAGVSAAVWPRHLALGAPLAVEARTALSTTGRLELLGPAGLEAAADAAQARRGAILTAHPKAAGRFLYRLVVRDAAGGEAASEPLDVTVEPPRPPRVVARFAAPSFESRALLRFLSAAGVPFAASLDLTRGRERLESSWPAAYGAAPPAAPLTAAGLAGCDVLILDGRSWQSLSPAEHAAVSAAVASGLGVLLFDADPAAGEARGFPLQQAALAGAPIREVRLAWPGEEPLAAITVPNRAVAPLAGAEPLLSNGEHRILAARLRQGRGAWALSLVEDSFQWTLAAEGASYGALWSRLLGAVARPDDAPRFALPSGPILVDRQLDATLLAPGPPPSPAPGAAAPRVELAEDGSASPVDLPVIATGPGRYAVRLWPRRAGWLRLTSSEGAAAWLYACGPRAWETWRDAEREAATALRASPPASGAVRFRRVDRPWPRVPFYLLFLAGAALLWFEERVRPRGAAPHPAG
jgi:hypothetical protein